MEAADGSESQKSYKTLITISALNLSNSFNRKILRSGAPQARYRLPALNTASASRIATGRLSGGWTSGLSQPRSSVTIR